MKIQLLALALLAATSGSSLAASGARIDLRAGGTDPLIIESPDAASGSVSGSGRDGSPVLTSGYANLRSGKMGLLASTTPVAAQDTFGRVEWFDNLTFTSSTVGEILLLTVRVTIDGTLGDGAQPNYSLLFGDLSRDVLRVNVGWRAPAAGLYSTESATFLNFNGSVPPGWSTFGPSTFEGAVSVVSGSPAFIAMGLTGNGPMDFSNTATFEVFVPQGVSLNSESGAFLVPVPEPSSLLFTLLGLAFVATQVMGRRRAEV